MRRALGWRLLLACLSTALLLIALEVGARTGGVADASWMARGGPLGWTAQADLSSFEVPQPGERKPFTIRTNADGLRTAYARARTEGRRRAVLFGESMVFGWGVEERGAPAAHLEAQLGADWEVVNAGQPGYSSEQMLRLARQVVPLYRPDVVVWVQPWNDTLGAPGTDRELLPRHWREVSLLVRQSHLLRYVLELRQREGIPVADHPVHALRIDQEGSVLRVPATDREAILEELHALVTDAGAGLVLVSLPPLSERALEHHEPIHHQLVVAKGRFGVPYVGLATDASLRALPTLAGDPEHFDSEGNEALMERVAPAVRSVADEGASSTWGGP